MSHNFKKGSTLYFALIILFLGFFAVASLLSILTVQLQTLKHIGFSVLSFYAADSGVEHSLYLGQTTLPPPLTECFESNYCYQTTPLSPGLDGCPNDSFYCIKSQGNFRGVQRAIKVTR